MSNQIPGTRSNRRQENQTAQSKHVSNNHDVSIKYGTAKRSAPWFNLSYAVKEAELKQAIKKTRGGKEKPLDCLFHCVSAHVLRKSEV